MKGLILRWLILSIAIMVAAHLFEGIHVDGYGSALIAAMVLGILNAFFRPILLILTLPINVLTLGLFTFVINALLLLMTSGVAGGLVVDGFGSALIGSPMIAVQKTVWYTLSTRCHPRCRDGAETVPTSTKKTFGAQKTKYAPKSGAYN